jgi:hypothetical protein
MKSPDMIVTGHVIEVGVIWALTLEVVTTSENPLIVSLKQYTLPSDS